MNIFLGVDAGGTKTHALIVDETGRVLGQGYSGNGNHQINRAEAERNVHSACDQALREANITKDDVTFAFFGMAGADRARDLAILRPIISGLEFKRFNIVCDTMIGMRAGTVHPYGLVIISGTGFNCAGRNAQGVQADYGGFGYMFGDGKGSGSDFAVHAFRSAVRAWDGRGEPTMLLDMVLKKTGYDSFDALYEDVLYGHETLPLDLGKLVFEAAEQGDSVAISILEEEGEELGNAARAIIRKLHMENESFDVVLAGSVLQKSKGLHLVEAIRRVVNSVAPQANIVKLEMEPVVGAVMSAMDESGHVIDEAAYAALKSITFKVSNK